MEFASKVEKFEGFLEGIKAENPVLVESILSGFKTIVEAGVPSHWSDEAFKEEIANEMDDEPLVEKKGQVELAPYVYAEVYDEDGKTSIWKKGFGDLAVSGYYDSKDFDDLVAEAKVNYLKMKTTGKYTKELVDDPKEVIEMNLTESLEDEGFDNIKYEIGSVTDKQENGDGGQFVKVFSKYGGKAYLIMTDSKRNGPWEVMDGMNDGKIITTKSTLEDALRYVDNLVGEFTTVKSVIDVLGDVGDVSSDDVIAFIKANDSKISDNLKADLFGYYHIADEDYVDENGTWLSELGLKGEGLGHDHPLRDELPGTTYTLEIDPEWQKAVDFIGDRYSTGSDFYNIVRKYLGKDDEWGAGKSVTAKLPEHAAWNVMDLFQKEDGDIDESAFGLLGGSARESLIRFIDQIV